MGLINFMLRKGLKLEKRFEFLGEPIAGSMSTYQKVREHKTNQEYGLKLLNMEKTTQFRQRLKSLELPSEAEITSLFKSRNVIKCHESGLTRAGQEFLLLEHCEGLRLDLAIERTRTRSLTPKIGILLSMIRAVEAVHEFDFLHRDLCPRNFFLDTKSGEVKLFDFGPQQARIHPAC